jgi:hypothetical protein
MLKKRIFIFLGLTFLNHTALAMSKHSSEYSFEKNTPRNSRLHELALERAFSDQNLTLRQYRIKKEDQTENHFQPFFSHYSKKKLPLTDKLREQLHYLVKVKMISPDHARAHHSTLLMVAAQYGDILTQRILIESGANLEEHC